MSIVCLHLYLCAWYRVCFMNSGWAPVARFDPTAKPAEAAAQPSVGAVVQPAAAKPRVQGPRGDTAAERAANERMVQRKAKKEAKKKARAAAREAAAKAGAAAKGQEAKAGSGAGTGAAGDRFFKLDASAVQVFGTKSSNIAGSKFSVLADRSGGANASTGFTFDFFDDEADAATPSDPFAAPGAPSAFGASAPVPEPTAAAPAKPFSSNFGMGGTMAEPVETDVETAQAAAAKRQKVRHDSVEGFSAATKQGAEAVLSGPAVLAKGPTQTALSAAARFFGGGAKAKPDDPSVRMVNYKRTGEGNAGTASGDGSGTGADKNTEADNGGSWWQRSRQRLAKDFKRKRNDARRMKRRR